MEVSINEASCSLERIILQWNSSSTTSLSLLLVGQIQFCLFVLLTLKGYERTGNTVDKTFAYAGDRPSRWTSEKDLWMFGYWDHDWADSTDRVASINPGAKTITLQTTGKYRVRSGQRYYAFNALSELDMPGEYYIDRQDGILYFWPDEPLTEQSSFDVSMSQGFIRGSDFSNIRFEDIYFEGNLQITTHISKPVEEQQWKLLD